MRECTPEGVASVPRTAFVLPGGGSAGAMQVGILLALFRRGIRPDVLVGCSVGALNAFFLALDPTYAQVERLAGIWRGIERKHVFGESRSKMVARVALRHPHVYEPGPLRSLIAQFCVADDLSDAEVPVHVATTDLDNGAARWWTSGPAVDVLYASACLPGLFPPIRIGGNRYVDGGVLEPVPVRRAVNTDAEVIYVLGDADGIGPPPSRRLSALEVLIRSFAISRYGPLPDPTAVARAGQRVIVVPGADTSGIDLRDFSQTERLLTESAAVATRFLEREAPRPLPTVTNRGPQSSTT